MNWKHNYIYFRHLQEKASKIEKSGGFFYLNLWKEAANFYFCQSTLLGMKAINILEENNA